MKSQFTKLKTELGNIHQKILNCTNYQRKVNENNEVSVIKLSHMDHNAT